MVVVLILYQRHIIHRIQLTIHLNLLILKHSTELVITPRYALHHALFLLVAAQHLQIAKLVEVLQVYFLL